jgi:predicted AAA+ superfamily ATPase
VHAVDGRLLAPGFTQLGAGPVCAALKRVALELKPAVVEGRLAARIRSPAATDAFVWNAQAYELPPVERVSTVPLDLPVGIGRVRETLLTKSERFAAA